ncbi:hypothetical protein BCV69DRAFT_313615 [Microstroma glucosiphilum]|uniref:HNH nuclease domain-containing protein n=1 Tax=Pseudomicrostroma glucosiphilum TaxID=1684307 RepID=A0A316U3Y8_9BASI|nr:hypothetical protein BCV69DRAFT_313615 [Pseudomicrostroma glucosiphilum]PWN19880.1 hypothetical protein BCV69DRAFT_313615 [Pseudomicrostroma glucosiphilum]
MATEYTLSTEWWTEGGLLELVDTSGNLMLSFPLAFLNAGHVATFDYVQQVLAMCFTGAINITSLDGTPKRRDQPIVAERLLVTSDATGIQATRGPRFKDAFRAPPNDDTASTMSHSSRSSVNQSTFRTKLQIRDGGCVISNAHFTASVPAHILPVSRPEYYREILGLHRNARLYDTSYGLLLARDLHHAFDRGSIALYPDENRLIVHVFTPRAAAWRPYHGKIILPSRFRTEFEPAPNIELLRFHYRQCCMMHLRGYAAQMNLPQRVSDEPSQPR